MLDRELSGRASLLHANNAAIEKQERDVARARDALRRENDKLQKLATEHTRKVKEIGNVQNWAEMLEREFLVIEETLRLVKRGGDGGGGGSGDEDDDYGSWSGSGSGSECPSDCECGRVRMRRRNVVAVDEEGDVVMENGPGSKGKGIVVDGEEMGEVLAKNGGEGIIAPETVPIPESPPLGPVHALGSTSTSN